MSAIRSEISPAAVLESPRISAFFFWVFMGVAMLLVIDPFNPGFNTEAGNLRLMRDLGPIKYVGLFFGWIALLLSLAGLGLERSALFVCFKNAFSRSWPILMMTLILLSGAIFSRTVLENKETFLPAALVMTAYF